MGVRGDVLIATWVVGTGGDVGEIVSAGAAGDAMGTGGGLRAAPLACGARAAGAEGSGYSVKHVLTTVPRRHLHMRGGGAGGLRRTRRAAAACSSRV